MEQPPLMESQTSKNTFGEGLGSSNPMKSFQTNVNENVNVDEESTEVPLEEPSLNDECDPNSTMGPDLTEFFTTDMVFTSRDAVIQWCQDVGREQNTVIVRGNGRNKVGGKGSYMVFQCERSGVFYSHHRKEVVPKCSEKLNTDVKRMKKRETGTKKCGCPFKVKSDCMEGDKWIVTVKCGIHNHPLPNTLTGHAFVGRLTKEEEKLVINLTLAGVSPKKILFSLKLENPKNNSTMRTLYNFRAKYRLEEMEGKSAMQYLETLLHRYHYVEWHEKTEDEVVLNILWSHPEAVMLAQCFPHLLIVDSTYNTNRFKMPLFHAVGVTSTGKTFTVAFAFMKGETEEHYTWALKHVKALYTTSNFPSVIITDRDLALINSVGIIFPEANRLLCTWHVGKNVQARCKFDTNPELWTKFNYDWHTVWTAETVDAYNKTYTTFATKWGDTHGAYVSYITDYWLTPFKENFVMAWTNNIKHYGNATTNRAESEHGKLKKWLDVNTGTFVTCWNAMHHMLQNEISEIKADFEKSLTQTKHKYQRVELIELRNFVSHLALDCLVDEIDRIGKNGMLPSNCGCVLRRTHGLPCAHELVRFKLERLSIPLGLIEPYWKQLSSQPYVEEERVDFDFLPELKHVRQRWIEALEPERAVIRQKLKELGTPSSTRMQEPRQKVKTKGRPSKKQRVNSTKRDPSLFEHAMTSESKLPRVSNHTSTKKEKKPTKPSPKVELLYLSEIPKAMQKYISSIEDVPTDGHCGYHVVAMKLGLRNSNGWRQVRDTMTGEIALNAKFYENMFGHDGVEKMKRRFGYSNGGKVTDEYWMQMPEDGFVIAEAYVTVVVLISKNMNFTFVPTRYPLSQRTKDRMIVIAHVNGNHYVGVTLSPGAPIPPEPPYGLWKRSTTSNSVAWLSMYKERIEDFERIMGYVKDKEPVIINLDA